ncbi:MAG: hypothetical protein AB7V32_09405 [Candidatus Berkiella sp.]
MQILTQQDAKCISGGNNLVITQQVSTEGLSNQCVQALANLLKQGELTDEQQAIYILSSCTMGELDILGDRLDAAPFINVEFV